jgi:hypothetical protein
VTLENRPLLASRPVPNPDCEVIASAREQTSPAHPANAPHAICVPGSGAYWVRVCASQIRIVPWSLPGARTSPFGDHEGGGSADPGRLGQVRQHHRTTVRAATRASSTVREVGALNPVSWDNPPRRPGGTSIPHGRPPRVPASQSVSCRSVTSSTTVADGDDSQPWHR